MTDAHRLKLAENDANAWGNMGRNVDSFSTVSLVSFENFSALRFLWNIVAMTTPVSHRHRRNSAELALGPLECHDCHQPTGEPRNGLCAACYWRSRRATVMRAKPIERVAVHCRCCGAFTSQPKRGACPPCYLAAWRGGMPLVERRAVQQVALPLEWKGFDRRRAD